MDKFIKIANRGKYFLIFVSGLVLCLMTLLYTNDIPWHSPPTDTSTPTSTFPPTFDSTIAQPSFCYSGPNESNLGAIPLSAGMDVEILAISDSEDWFMIRGVDIDPCWVEANVLYISSSFDPRRVQVFTTIITTENTACRIFPDSGRTVQTIIPIDRRIVSYGKSDPEAKWILVVPHDSTKFCWIENKSGSNFPSLLVEAADFALAPTPTSTNQTATPSLSGITLCLPADNCVTETITATPTFHVQTATPSLQALDIVATQAKQQFDNAIESNIAFVYPQTMDLGKTVVFELRLSPLENPTQLVAAAVESRGLTPIGTNISADLQGNSVVVESASGIKSTEFMKAELKPQNPDAFVVERLHSDDVQFFTNGIWQWSITAKEKGVNYLTLNIYMLYKVDGKETWTQVKSYEKSIEVTVKPLDQISSFDWKWIVGILIPALFIPLFFRWYDKKRRKPTSQKPTPKGKRKLKSEK